MKKTILYCIALMGFITACQSTGLKKSLNKKSLLNDIEVLEFKDSEAKKFSVYIWSSDGLITEDEDRVGVSSLLMESLKKNTKNKSNKELKSALSELGVEIDAGVSDEQLYIGSTALTEDSNKLAELLIDVVFHPSFEAKTLKSLKSKQMGEIEQLKDNPSALASYLYQKQIFQNHPYARYPLGSKKTVSNIQMEDLEERYNQILDPGKIKLVLIGNWSPDAEVELISTLSDLEKKIDSEKSGKVNLSDKDKERVFYSKRGLKQAQVKFGTTSIERSSLDYLPLKLGLFVLGGSFKSVLNSELRVKKGLTYGVNASLNSFSNGGYIEVSSAVRHEKLKEFISTTERILKNFVDRGVTQEELDKTKAFFKGQYPKTIETLEQEAMSYLSLESKGVPGDEIYSILNKIDKVTIDEVNGALRRQFDLNRLNLTVLGDHRKIKNLKPLKVRLKKM